MSARCLFAKRGRCSICGCTMTFICYDSPSRVFFKLASSVCPNCGTVLAAEPIPPGLFAKLQLGMTQVVAGEEDDDADRLSVCD